MKGRVLGDCRLLSSLGAGAMATVWLAETVRETPWARDGERVAVKVVHPHLLSATGSIERFVREARIGAQIRHPNVVRTFDAGTAPVDGAFCYYLVMEFVEGQNLRELLEELGRLPEHLCLHVAREVSRALEAIHAAGIVHRDLKPGNVLLTRDDEVKVMDLGVAHLKAAAIRLSETGQFLGSPLYAAPEQFGGAGELDGRVDLYALGLLLYEMSTGQHPFAGLDLPTLIRRQIRERPASPGRMNPQLSPFFDAVVGRLLEKRREERPASAAEALAILEGGEESDWWRERSARGRTAGAGPARRMRIPREAALRGRDEEIARLEEAWRSACLGDGRTVVVVGEAGVGKSRLVDDFAARLEAAGDAPGFVFGSYPPGGAATGPRAFSAAFLDYLGEDVLEARLERLLPGAPELVRTFAAFLRGVPLPGDRIGPDAIASLFIDLARALARERPLLVLVDDLHFAPDEGRSLFTAMAHAIAGDPILLVGTTRPAGESEGFAPLRRLPHASFLTLDRLETNDVAALLRDALGSETTAEALREQVMTSSDGNPWIVFEILGGLSEAGILLRGEDGSTSLAADVGRLRIPGSVRDLVRARVSAVGDEEREILEVAACCGFRFEPDLVARAANREHLRTLRNLSAVERRHGVVRSLGRYFQFDHHQVQETLYEELSIPLREEYHAAIARAWLEREHAAGREPAQVTGDAACTVAGHLLRGGRGDEARPFLEPALSFLESTFRNDRALDLAELALSLPALLEGKDRAGILARKGRILMLLGRPGAEGAFLEAVRLFDAAGEVVAGVEARRELGRLAWQAGRSEEAIELLSATLETARRVGNPALEGGLLGDLGNVHAHTGRYEEALEYHRMHREVARRAGDRAGEASAIGNLAVAAFERGDFEEARREYEVCLPIFREQGVRRGECVATGNLGLVQLELGRFDAAAACFDAHLELSRAIGYRRGQAMAIGNRGLVHQARGLFARALDDYDQQLRIFREIGDRIGEGSGRQMQGDIFAALGDREAGRDTLEEALRIHEALDFPWGAVTSLARLGRLLVDDGEFEAAEAMLDRAEALARRIGKRNCLAEILLDRFRVLRHRGDSVGARKRLGEAREIAAEVRSRDLSLLAVGWLARVDGDPGPLRRELVEQGGRVFVEMEIEARWHLYRLTEDPRELAEAWRLLQRIVGGAPPGRREALVARVWPNASIASAHDRHLADGLST